MSQPVVIPTAAPSREDRMENYARQTRNAAVTVAVLMVIGVVLALIVGILVGVQLGKVSSNLHTINNYNSSITNGTNPNCSSNGGSMNC